MCNILITGITSGIGKALAIEFATLGHTIIGCGRDKHKLQLLQETKLGLPHTLSIIDIKNLKEVKKWAKHVYHIYNKIDILINNAATKNELLPLWEISSSDFENTINTNIIGTANVLHSFLPEMVNRNSGIIVNMSSEWGREGDAYVTAYCASKFAIEGLTKSLAKELPSNMVTIALSPLIVLTDLLEKCRNLLLPGEYELGVKPEDWAKFAAPKILALAPKDNGKSLTWSPSITS